jgi:hypothetical protein
VQVWRGVVATTIATDIFGLGLDFLFGYGLEFLPGTVSLERGMLPWLDIGSRVFFHNYSLFQG